MPSHAYWQGQIRISLVQLPVSLMTATRRSSQMPLHEYDRTSGSRIHHRDVTEDGASVKPNNIVKGYELTKTDIVFLEENEIKKLKLPSSDVFEVEAFVPLESIPLYYIERPYYVMPEGKNAGEIYTTIHTALLKSGKAGIGQLAIRGREELCALIAIKQGLMLETLRYQSEIIDPDDAFSDLASKKGKQDYAKMAEQLIAQNTQNFDLTHYHDRYHEALTSLVNAKKHHRKLAPPPRAAKSEKVVNFMDALKKSLKTARGSKKDKAA